MRKAGLICEWCGEPKLRWEYPDGMDTRFPCCLDCQDKNAHIDEFAIESDFMALRRKEYAQAKAKEWHKAHPEVKRNCHERRRAAKLGCKNSLTGKKWKEILEQFDYRCAYCGGKSPEIHQEHIVPLSKGGAHSVDNVVPACPRCNMAKGTKSLLIFLRDCNKGVTFSVL